jgi:galactose mutarotase-like enzyme
MATIYTLESTSLRAEVSDFGAELVRLQDAEGRDLLWDGNPDFWTGRAPLLFPIVGKMANDHLRLGDSTYPIRQHGIARISPFELVAASSERCEFLLRANAETQKAYPFNFALDVICSLEGNALTIEASAMNQDNRVLPVSFGFHPAFRWPLPYGGAREDHAITFEKPEPAPVRRLTGGLMDPEPKPSPIEGDRLPLRDDLFTADALILDQPASRAVTYGGPTGPKLRVSFPDMPQLGLWSKPGAGFVCIEPWYGYASPAGFDGDINDKPGMTHIPPGGSAGFAMKVELVD